jgi:serine/threonine protein phosphatase PrpC
MDFTSKTFGKISLFGILHGIGENGSIISRSVRNFIINYFEHSDIETSLNKDNFYTILANVFLNANSFLKNILSEHYDTTTSGTTCQLLFFPNDLTHNVYCVNAGNSKTVLYSYSENVPLSYEHYPSRPCESEYILKHGNNVNIVTRSVNAMEGSQREQSLIVKTNNCLIEGFPLSRVLGCFMWEHAGVTADPEVIEANLNKENAKVIVMGTNGLWKYLTKDIVGQIAMRYYEEGNAFAASKDLEETARMKWRKYSKEVDDITVIVIYCKWEKYKA